MPAPVAAAVVGAAVASKAKKKQSGARPPAKRTRRSRPSTPLNDVDVDSRTRAGDNDEHRREAAAADRERQELYDQGVAEGRQTPRRQPVRRNSGPGRVREIAHDGAGLLLALIAFALLRSYLTGGLDGAKSWLKAKFLNDAADPGADGAPSPSAPSSPGQATPPSARIIPQATPSTPAWQLPPRPGTLTPVTAVGT